MNTLTPSFDVYGLPLAQLQDRLLERDVPGYRAKQLYQAIHRNHVRDPQDIHVLPATLRDALTQEKALALPEIASEQVSEDGTRKWLFRFKDGRKAETVYIPERDRGTLCVSSQIGCSLSCSFCYTGTQKLERNLSSAEIVGQVFAASDRLLEAGAAATAGSRAITNIVMMGQGEPLINYDQVALALKVLTSQEGYGFSTRRITLSTSGYVPNIVRCGEDLGVELAISLHATEDKTRDMLVPLNRKYPIDVLLDACRAYPKAGEYRKITYEYVMLDGINDSDEDAHRLADMIDDIPAKVNMIPFNPWPGSIYACSTPERIRSFRHIIERADIPVTVRTPRGRDISAACGQLKSADEAVTGVA